jgi:hypothetical protein
MISLLSEIYSISIILLELISEGEYSRQALEGVKLGNFLEKNGQLLSEKYPKVYYLLNTMLDFVNLKEKEIQFNKPIEELHRLLLTRANIQIVFSLQKDIKMEKSLVLTKLELD